MTQGAIKYLEINTLVSSCFALAATAMLSGCGAPSESNFEALVRQSQCTTADQVYADYQNNEVAAQQKYQGSVNRVCGIIEEIELNFLDRPVISLRVSGLGALSIGGIDAGSAANLSKGSFAVFECAGINELLGNPVLYQCRMASAPGVSTDSSKATPATSPQQLPAQTSYSFLAGKCKLRIDGTIIFQGACPYRLENDGSFYIYESWAVTEGKGGFFATLLRDGAVGIGYWNGSRNSSHAQASIGEMHRDGACWLDRTRLSEMCLWAE